MSYPIVLLVGKAGAGKDAVASILKRNHGFESIAQADPLKQLAKIVFGFSMDQLWGPSSSRNAPDAYWTPERLVRLKKELLTNEAHDWLKNVTEGVEYRAHVRPERNLADWIEQITDECVRRKEVTPRLILQSIGVDFGRAINKDIWSIYAIKVAQKLLRGGYTYDRVLGVREVASARPCNGVVISDGRFTNELLNVLQINGHVWRIDGSDLSAEAQNAGFVNHVSETEQDAIPDSFYTAFLVNDKSLGLSNLETEVGWMARKYLGL